MQINKLVIDIAFELGADLIGIAKIEEYNSLPPELQPANILPTGKTVICYALAQLRGALNAAESGLFKQALHFDSEFFLEQIEGPRIGRQIVRVIEDAGYMSSRIQSMKGKNVTAPRKTRAEHLTPPNAYVEINQMAAGCGLGKLMANGQFITPEFGAAQKIFCIITEAELTPSRFSWKDRL